MDDTSPRSATLTWAVAALLALMLVGAAAMAYWLPVRGYDIACKKSGPISCELQRESASGHQAWQVALDGQSIATVKIQPRRRGTARVFLYLSSSNQSVFAAEFEGGAAVARAGAAAAELNRVFSSASPASTHVVVRPPAYFTWLIWGGVGFLVVLVLVIYRELFSSRRQAGKLTEQTNAGT